MGYIGNQSGSNITYTNLGSFSGTVADAAALAALTGMVNGDLVLQDDTNDSHIYNGSAWINLGPITGPQGPIGNTGPQGIPGNDGAPGTIDHIARTIGDGSAGTTDTYTAYADVGETQLLGTFDVYNGLNGDSLVTSVAGRTGDIILSVSDITDFATATIDGGTF